MECSIYFIVDILFLIKTKYPYSIILFLIFILLENNFSYFFNLFFILFASLVLLNLLLSKNKGLKKIKHSKFKRVYYITVFIVIIITVFFSISNYFLTILVYLYKLDFLSFFLTNFLYSNYPKNKKLDFIIVLGCGLTPNNKITPMLDLRLKKAVHVYKKLNPLYIIVSGGSEHNCIAEAHAMHDYLIKCGIEKWRILIEEESRNTHENIIYSLEILLKRNVNLNKGGVITSNFHISKTYYYCKLENFKIIGIAAKTPIKKLFIILHKEYTSLLMSRK